MGSSSIFKVEGVEAHQEAYLHSPLKWVDEDDSTNFVDETDSFVAINRRLASEDQLNGNLDSPNQGDMPNAIEDPLRDDTTAPKNGFKTLNRGISRATDNVNIVSRVRSELVIDHNDEEYSPIETPIYTFTLPDFTQFTDDFREFLEKDLISISTQTSLEQSNRLNWWTTFAQRLWPLSTSGDGNCLLHAASLGMWGFHDRLLTLRKALHGFLSQSPCREALWRRWKHQQSILNAQAGLVYSEVEWRREWNAIVSMASTTPRLRRQSIVSSGKGDSFGNIYESLEEIHVLALAHVLKRPIIVIADVMLKDMNGEALAPIPFGGIYLPFECSPTECYRSPLLLAYDGGHFSALVAMDHTNHCNTFPAIPLVDSTNDLLCVQFHKDPGDSDCNDATELSYKESVSLLNEYLDLVHLDSLGTSGETNKNGLLGSLGRSVGNKLRLKLTRSNSVRNAAHNKVSQHILCALLHTDKRHEYLDIMIENYLQSAKERFHQTNVEPPRYGAGKSRFYAQADSESHEKVSQLTPVKATANNDPTLYLSKSTFYETGILCRAENCTFYGNDRYDYYCSKCYQELADKKAKS